MNIFAICYYAPPQLTPQAIQIGRQLFHMDAGVTLLHGRDPRFADSFDQYPDFFERVRGLAVADPGPPFKGVLHRAARRLLPLYGACPDLLGPWRRKAYPRALGSLAEHWPDALLSFGMPMSDHLLALRLKRRTGLPWLAHFSDPWVDNLYLQTSALERRVNAALERRVLAHADQVLFTSARTLSLVMDKYPAAWRARAAVLPHAWDLDHFSTPLAAAPPRRDAAPAAARRHTVRYIGACYGARSPEPLFAALAHIARHQPRALDTVVFEFIGHISPHFLASAAFQALPPGLVVLRGAVAYRESLQLTMDASALLVIDAPSATESVFLPSKLVESIGAGRPVWGITPAGTAADLIAAWSGGCHASADPADPHAVERMLLSGLARLDAGLAASGSPEVAQRFAAHRVAAALKEHVRHAMLRCSTWPGGRVRVRPLAR